jgi:protein tyrosine/serine phosphatase
LQPETREVNVPRFIRRLFRVPYDGMRHFGIVADGQLYRCGQPTPEQLAQLIDEYDLRTVVSLRGTRDEDDPDAWESEERAVCADRGVDFITIPCNHKNPPTAEQAQQFLDICREESARPVLVHCRLGQQRTLLFCALYRVHVDGLDPSEAEREMDALGFGAHKRRHQKLLTAFRHLANNNTLPSRESDGEGTGARRELA